MATDNVFRKFCEVWTWSFLKYTGAEADMIIAVLHTPTEVGKVMTMCKNHEPKKIHTSIHHTMFIYYTTMVYLQQQYACFLCSSISMGFTP